MQSSRNPQTDPAFSEYEAAVEHGRRLAGIARASYTVCAEVGDNKLGFFVLLSEQYASLRERGLTHSMAPVASILSNGQLNEYHFRRHRV